MQPLGENTTNTPAFLGKLWKMVNDPSTDHLICWSASGTSFVIPNQAQFWYELLPLYYKHNNMSSFVRQLNMYGFHKLSTVENGAMDSDKDEIQFSHPFFLRDKPELLRNIKRKATASKASNENGNRHDDLTKVLSDVKQLRGRQQTVDNQLNAMKQENALLWREVAILRQKHLKQQKIVNKLIQFLVTLVQPSRMPVGVKRGYQLMLNESPSKKCKGNNAKNINNAEGPTIHELDSELELPPSIYDEDPPVEVEGSHNEVNDAVDSPTGYRQADVNSPIDPQLITEGDESTWEKPDYVDANEVFGGLEEPVLADENLINSFDDDSTEMNRNGSTINQKVFLNPTTQDTLLSNLIKNNFTVKPVKQDDSKDLESKLFETLRPLSPTPATSNNMALTTRDPNLSDVVKSMPSTSEIYSPDHLSNHVEMTQNELEQFKDILNGYNSVVEANALLGLFHEDSPLDLNADKVNPLGDSADPLVSGSELATYGSNFDFTELLDDSMDGVNDSVNEVVPSTVNTPQVLKEEPIFPSINESGN